MDIGQKIKEKRAKIRMTQRAIAAQIGVTEATIGNWERDVTSPSVSDLYVLASALGCSAIDFLGDAPLAQPEDAE